MQDEITHNYCLQVDRNLVMYHGDSPAEVLQSVYFENVCEIKIKHVTTKVWVHRLDVEDWKSGSLKLSCGRSLTDVLNDLIEGGLCNGQIDGRSNARIGRSHTRRASGTSDSDS